MLREVRERLRERRREYSLGRHLARLRREGRLSRVALTGLAFVAIGSVAFAHCDGSRLTGPSDLADETPIASTVTVGGSVASAGSETYKENIVERNVVFSGVNPCNGDVVTAIGKRHDRIRIVASPTSFAVDHHLNDSFRGEAINDPDQEYTGSDVHNDRFEVGIDGVEHRELTNEHLISQGPAPNWILHFHQRSDFRFSDPLNPTVTYRAHASCPPESACMLPGGCVDRELTPVSVTP